MAYTMDHFIQHVTVVLATSYRSNRDRERQKREAMSRAERAAARDRAVASVEEIKRLSRAPITFGGRVTTGGAGHRLPRSSPPASFSYYQGSGF